MPEAHFEVPVGAIDGVNRLFTVSLPYTPGSVAVFINGQLKRADYDDGWVETDPSTGQVTVNESPIGGSVPEVVQIFYLDTTQNDVTEVVEGIIGTIEDLDMLYGTIGSDDIVGTVVDLSAITGTIDDVSVADGAIEEVDELVGVITCP